MELYRRCDQPVKAAEYAKQEGCCRRTVYNDLEELQQAGFPLWNDIEGGWRVLDDPIPARLRNALGAAA
jgi:predicted DNA-binding transcriptional regulator YafY